MPADQIRVVALGGCGGMGQFAVRTALGFEFVDEFVIADRDEPRAREFAGRCGPKTNSVGVDVTDEDALARVLVLNKNLINLNLNCDNINGAIHRLHLFCITTQEKKCSPSLELQRDWIILGQIYTKLV